MGPESIFNLKHGGIFKDTLYLEVLFRVLRIVDNEEILPKVLKVTDVR